MTAVKRLWLVNKRVKFELHEIATIQLPLCIQKFSHEYHTPFEVVPEFHLTQYVVNGGESNRRRVTRRDCERDSHIKQHVGS